MGGDDMTHQFHQADDARDIWRWPNFTPREMACKGTGRLLVVPEFMDRLQALRDAYRRPIIINSAYRSPEHNRAVGGAVNSPHVEGRAVDIRVYGAHALELIRLAIDLEFTGIGLRQHGPHERRFLHIDDVEPISTARPRPWCWTYGN